MLGPMGAFIMSILRVMTPAEIDRYAKTSADAGVHAIAAGGEEFDLMNSDSYVDEDQAKEQDKQAQPQGEAKIIPIRSKVDFQNNDQPPDSEQEKSLDGDSELETLGIFSGAKQHAMQEAAHAKEKSEQESTSVFLISERKRLKKTSEKMNTSDALKTYNESANMDLRKPQIDLDADPDKDEAIGSRGILINKKQY